MKSSRFARLGATVRTAFTRNAGLKIFSILLACVMWYVTNVLERDAERVLQMPLVMRHVPTDLVLIDAPRITVQVTVHGPRTLLEGVEEARARFVLPVRTLLPGENHLDLQAGRVEPELARRVRIVRLQPGRVDVRAEPLHRRQLPVRIELAGSPAFGYTVAESEVIPREVEVAGPASVVDQLETVQTVPIDLRGLSRSVERSVALEWVGDYVTFDPDPGTVRARIEEVVVTREFRGVRVQVAGPPGVHLEPPTITLSVRGPERLLHNFTLPAGAAYVDASHLPAGTHQVEVVVDLPAPFEVVTRRPEVQRVVVPESAAAEPAP